jgi:hypothetical protein
MVDVFDESHVIRLKRTRSALTHRISQRSASMRSPTLRRPGFDDNADLEQELELGDKLEKASPSTYKVFANHSRRQVCFLGKLSIYIFARQAFV